jgi:hypothetical protein
LRAAGATAAIGLRQRQNQSQRQNPRQSQSLARGGAGLRAGATGSRGDWPEGLTQPARGGKDRVVHSGIRTPPAMVPADPFPLSRALLEAVLADRTSDRFVCELVWRRLGYAPSGGVAARNDTPAGEPPTPWLAGATTPASWAEAFPRAPEVIAQRAASVALTRSVPMAHKQLLKQQLGFAGYRIGELYPRRTRRATAVNWLLAHLAEQGETLPETGALPALLEPPADPREGHPGDPPVG